MVAWIKHAKIVHGWVSQRKLGNNFHNTFNRGGSRMLAGGVQT